jgi:DNA polymerase-3 subunit alpha
MDEESTYQDEQIVSIAGVVQSIKMKTTRNNSMMAYVTLEDDTASIEMLAFSNVLSQYGNYIRENLPVVIVGRLSMRDDKEPQIVINRACPMSDYTEQNRLMEEMSGPAVQKTGTLYLRLPSEEGTLFQKIRAILGMFPGDSQVVVYFADTKQRRGTRCVLMGSMLRELQNVLGNGNVVVK